MTMETRTRLPEFLRPLFWDVAFHTLSPERHQSFICLRIIEDRIPDARQLLDGLEPSPVSLRAVGKPECSGE